MCSFFLWRRLRKKRFVKEGLEARNIDIKKVEKVAIRDLEGELYPQGAKVHYKIYANNKKQILLEIKDCVYEEDVNDFLAKARFFEKKKNVKTQKIIIALNIDDKAKQLCEKLGIETITQE